MRIENRDDLRRLLVMLNGFMKREHVELVIDSPVGMESAKLTSSGNTGLDMLVILAAVPRAFTRFIGMNEAVEVPDPEGLLDLLMDMLRRACLLAMERSDGDE